MEQNVQQLIKQVIAGQQTAQMAFYRRYAPKLYPVCRRMMAATEPAEEVLQDAFLKIFAHLMDFDSEAQLMAWMRCIVQRTAIDALRREPFEWDRISEQTLQEAEEEPVDETIIGHRVEAVKLAVDKLPPGYRAVLTLYLFEGYDFEEIAQILHLQPASARSQYLRAKTKLLALITAANSTDF